jgi:hypothetical protein
MLIVGLVYWAVARRAHRSCDTALTGEERDAREVLPAALPGPGGA